MLHLDPAEICRGIFQRKEEKHRLLVENYLLLISSLFDSMIPVPSWFSYLPVEPFPRWLTNQAAEQCKTEEAKFEISNYRLEIKRTQILPRKCRSNKARVAIYVQNLWLIYSFFSETIYQATHMYRNVSPWWYEPSLKHASETTAAYLEASVQPKSSFTFSATS